MRFASRRVMLCGLLLAAAFLLLGGCMTDTKKHYLRHLSVTIDPVATADGPVAGSDFQPAMGTFRNRPAR